MIDGLLLLDKPAGPTSHDVVAGVRAALGGARAGHTGTLDPAATGLLAVVTGRATRLARYLPHEPKTYVGRLVLGVTTSTDDITGVILHRHEGELPADQQVARAASALVGRNEQVPPAVSAKRVGGKRLYKLARAGRPSTAAPVAVTIDRFAVAPTGDPRIFDYELAASSGTYVRAAVRDLGRALGCGATVETLRRIGIGAWGVAAALPWPAGPDDVRAALIGLDELPLVCPRLNLLRPEDAPLFAAGTAVPYPPGAPEGVEVAVRSATGNLIGIGEVSAGLLRPRVVLAVAHPEPV
ncbi:MAG TPA: tRNA pseudouridine(55) synthase TruB [Candidatus Polarisedimenticolaceae bacterium]|nr:tRNA pseudouridine(55) synthase TruB [Candidatus Polarisedimenticolaceae bacterium]